MHSGIDDFPNARESDLRESMPVLRDLGLPLLAHAELDLGAPAARGDPRAYAGTSRRVRRRGRMSDSPARRISAARRAVTFISFTSRRPARFRRCSAPKTKGCRSPWRRALTICASTLSRSPTAPPMFKCAPPIRNHENREALWQGLFEGVIDFVITDHSPCLRRSSCRSAVTSATRGAASRRCSSGLPAIWSEARARGASLAQMAAWMSARPAKFAGSAAQGPNRAGLRRRLRRVGPRRGVLAVNPGDLFFRTRCRRTSARRSAGRVDETWLRGVPVFRARSAPGSRGARRGARCIHRAGGPAAPRA